uniref:ROK family protein n=1 Tax=Ignisphaera aggregans TaxID=334771 RepID=A0A7C2VLP3_9CREN
MKRHVIGVDVGGTWIRIALASRDGTIMRRIVLPTPREGDRYTIANLIAKVVKKELDSYLDTVEAVGIGTVGPLDLASGSVVGAPNIPIRNFDLGKPLADILGKKIIIANDCVAAVWGEKLFGLGRAKNNIVYITLSTGIGGGVIVDGTLLLGKMGNAHEIGHMVVDISGKMQCGCGGRGHWEAYASGANIPRFVSRLLEEWELTQEEKNSNVYKLYLDGRLNTESVYREAEKGDPLAVKLVNEINRYNIAGFETVINLYDPEVISVGGSIALKNRRELVLDPIIKGVKQSRGIMTVLPTIDLTPLGENAVLIGAIALALKPPSNLLSMLKFL